MSFDFPQPLRLAVGSHQAGSGRGCAMNVISYENGDKEITDYPPCADYLLTQVVQNINDSVCKETDAGLLCPECSVKVLDLAHRTVGTGMPGGWVAQIRLYGDLSAAMGAGTDWRLLADSFYASRYKVENDLAIRTIEDAHRLIDKFEELTGIKAKPVPAEVTEQAVSKMREKVDA